MCGRCEALLVQFIVVDVVVVAFLQVSISVHRGFSYRWYCCLDSEGLLSVFMNGVISTLANYLVVKRRAE